MRYIGPDLHPETCPKCRLPLTPVADPLFDDGAHAIAGRRHMGVTSWSLLKMLRRRPGMVFEIAALHQHLYGNREDANEQGVRHVVMKLRRQLEGTPYEIMTVHGVGYALVRRDAP